ncbi:unnamed protein product [Prunus brigantina]
MGDRNTSQPSAAGALLTSGQDAQINLWMMVSRNHEVLQNIWEMENSLRELCERREMEKSLGELGKTSKMEKSLAALCAQQIQLVDLTKSMSEQLRSLQRSRPETAAIPNSTVDKAVNPYPSLPRNHASMTVDPEVAIRSVYLFVCFGSEELTNAIYEVKFKHGGVASEPLVVELVNRFCEGEKNENVGTQGAVRIFHLSNLYVPTKDGGYIIDTKTMSRSSSFPPTLGYKSVPIFVSAYDKLYCLASPLSIPPIPEPSFERFDPDTNMWEKMPPYPFYNDYEIPMNITGYVVCYGVILFSLCSIRENNFDVVAFHVGRKQWKPVEVDDSVYNAPFQGRAVVVGKTIYSLRQGEVIAFSLGLDKDDNGGVVYNLNQLFVLQGLEVADPLFAFDMCWTENLVHLGNNDFFHVKTECGNDTVPYLRITTFQIVVGEGGRHMIKTIHSNVHSLDLEYVEWFNLLFCFTFECGDYEPTEEESVTSMNQPKQVETSLDDNCSVVKQRRMAKKEARRGIAARKMVLNFETGKWEVGCRAP